MKRLTKIAAMALVALSASSVFAQNAEYKKLLAKGKEYESKKEYVYALGYYYDAMQADLKNAHEALNCFQDLTSILQEGRPGREKSYTKNSLHTAYLDLLKNADKYWTEFLPDAYTFKAYINDENSRADDSTGTGTYYAHIRLEGTSAKYNEIMKPILRGLKEKWTSGWTEIPETWPEKPLTYAEDADYENTGVTFYTDFNNSQPVYKQMNKQKKTEEYIPQYDRTYTSWNFGAFTPSDEGSKTMCDIQLAVCNSSTGKEIFASDRVLVYNKGTSQENDHYYNNIELTEVPEKVMNVINSGNAFIKIKNMYLMQGKTPLVDLIAYTEKRSTDPLNREFMNNLTELNYAQVNPLSLSRITIFKNTEEKESYYNQESIPHLIHALNANYAWIRVEDKDTGVSADLWSTKVTQKEYESIMDVNPNRENKDNGKHIGANKPAGFITANMAIEYCNKRSLKEKLTPCYSVDDYGNWICNIHANGYRIMTLQEESAAFGTTSNFWAQDDYTGEFDIHDVALLDGNEAGLYDFVGNGIELKFFIDDRGKCYSYRKARFYLDRETKEFSQEPPEADEIPTSRRGLIPVKKDADEDKAYYNTFRVAKTSAPAVAAWNKAQSAKMASINWVRIKDDSLDVDTFIWPVQVTQKEYESIMGSNPNKENGKFIGENKPVTFITANMAIEYCNKRSLKEKLVPCYKKITDVSGKEIWECNLYATGYRLMTEKEIAAAYGTVDSEIYDEDKFYEQFWPTNKEIAEIAVKNADSNGLYDMYGNGTELNMVVFEDWCYEENHYSPFAAKSKLVKPTATNVEPEDDSKYKFVSTKPATGLETSAFRVARATPESIAKDNARIKIFTTKVMKAEAVQYMDKELAINVTGQNLTEDGEYAVYNKKNYYVSNISKDKKSGQIIIPLDKDYYAIKDKDYSGEIKFYVDGRKKRKLAKEHSRVLIDTVKVYLEHNKIDVKKTEFCVYVDTPSASALEKYKIPVTVKINDDKMNILESNTSMDVKTGISTYERKIYTPKVDNTYKVSVEYNGTEIASMDLEVTDIQKELENAFKDIAEPVECVSDGDKNYCMFNVKADQLAQYSPKPIKAGDEIKFVKGIKKTVAEVLKAKKEDFGIKADFLSKAAIRMKTLPAEFKVPVANAADGKLKDVWCLAGKDSMFVFVVEFDSF